jgi:hypothetical protein
LNDHTEENAYHAAVEQAWASEPHPIRAALTRTGVAYTPAGPDAYYTVDGITDFGQSLWELHNVDAVDWEGTRIAATNRCAPPKDPPLTGRFRAC